MKKIIIIVLLISDLTFSQKNNDIIKDLNLPNEYKSYLLANDFLDLLKKSKKYKKQKKTEEFEFKRFSD